MIIDSHCHFSSASDDAAHGDRGALARHPHLAQIPVADVEQLLAEAAQGGVDRIVQVTQVKMGYDNSYGLQCARRFPEKILGVIGRFDPLPTAVEERLHEFASQQGMLGVRLTLHLDENRHWLSGNVLAPFFKAAEKVGIPVQLYAPGEYVHMREAARQFRGVRFVIDHLGASQSAKQFLSREFSGWESLRALAAEPNVWMKVSGVPEMAMNEESFPYPKGQQLLRRLYEEAGASRWLWGSDYPPVLKACTYQQALNFVREHCVFLSASELADVLGNNFLKCFSRVG